MTLKIGIGITTCNRPEFFEQCIKSISPDIGKIVIVNDGHKYNADIYPSYVNEIIQHDRNMSVGVSKNQELRWMMNNDCDHLFLMEDDIIIKNNDVFEKYIKTASEFGIWHLNYGLHGNYNRDQNNNPVVKQVIQGKNNSLYLYHNCLGAFSYYYKGIIKNIGYMDEVYKNAMEHVDHTKRIIDKGLHPPFWWFADIEKSWEYLQDLTDNYEGSEIRKDKTEWQKNFHDACLYFQYKHGNIPMKVPETSLEDTVNTLKDIHGKYAKEI